MSALVSKKEKVINANSGSIVRNININNNHNHNHHDSKNKKQKLMHDNTSKCTAHTTTHVASHSPSDPSHTGNTTNPMVVLYESLVNTRRIISSLDIETYHRQLYSATEVLLGHANILSRQKGMDMNECLQAFQALRVFHANQSSSYRTSSTILKVTTLLDECYFTLYYCLDLQSRLRNGGNRGGRHNLVPPPHTYFASSILTPVGRERQTSSFLRYLRRNISDTTMAKLRSIWGNDLMNGTSLSQNKKNPLIQLHFALWKQSICLLCLLDMIPDETEVLSLLRSCKPQRLASPTAATMKGTDPLLPDFVREYNDSCRIWPCRLYAFATPNQESIERLASLAPLVELGAGTGYWSQMVRTHSPTSVVHSYDKDPPSVQKNGKHNDYHGKCNTWFDVQKGGPEILSRFQNCTLFLCYPPPDAPMALLSLRAYTGDCVCYVGEWQGDTGTRAFEKLLCETFTCEEIISLPNWGDTCYMMMIWRRRKGVTPVKDIFSNHQSFPVLCSHCGYANDSNERSATSQSGMSTSLPLQRCRISYSVYFCSAECAVDGRNRHLEELSIKCLLQREPQSQDSCDGDSSNKSSKKRKRESDVDTSVETRKSPLVPLISSHFVRVQSPRYLQSDKSTVVK